jgi:hypothetical protein
MQTRSTQSARVPSSPAAAEQATFMDVVTSAPGAAALIFAALGDGHDGQEARKALRLAHPLICAAVDETTKQLWVLATGKPWEPSARAPTARRFPALLAMTVEGDELPIFEGMAGSPFTRLERLNIFDDAPPLYDNLRFGRALVAALRCMPRLAKLEFEETSWVDDALVEAISKLRLPFLREFSFISDVFAPGFGPAAVRAIASTSWPLEKLSFDGPDFSSDDAGPAIAALHRFGRLRFLRMTACDLSPEVLKVATAVRWPALERLDVSENGLPPQFLSWFSDVHTWNVLRETYV